MNVKAKICGLRTEADIEAVNEARPDFAGFIFAPGRKRYIRPEDARILREQLDPGITPVGVFVNAPAEEILKTAAAVGLGTVQLHGQESETFVMDLKEKSGGGLRIIKAFRVSSTEDVRLAEGSPADLILLDNGRGGTGETFDWETIRDIKRPFILAGGIGADNVADAVRKTRPYAVDASSSLETDGHKDREKILRFMAAVRELRKEEL